MVLAGADSIGVVDLGIRIVGKGESASVSHIFEHGESLNLHQVERDMLLTALQESRANVSKAARMLGISRDTLRYRAKKFAISI